MRHRISPARASLPLILLLAFIALCAACSQSGSVMDREPVKAATKPQAKQLQDYDLMMVDAPPIKLSQLMSKNKVVLLNFWATWCGPCRQEVPHLKALQQEYQSRGVEFIGLSIEDPRDALDKVREFAKNNAINYRLGFASSAMFQAFNGNDPRMPIPQSFIFGRDGNLVPGGHIQGSSPRIREILQEAIEKALKSSS